MGHWKKNAEKSNREKILKSIPEPPKKIRSGDLFEKLMQQKISNATIHKHLKELVKEGAINRIEESHKKVFYQQGELAELESLISRVEKITPDSLRRAYKQLDDNKKEAFLKEFWKMIGEVELLLLEESERSQ